MKPFIAFILLLFVFAGDMQAQDTTRPHLYHPEADAAADIKAATARAARSGKHVLLQIGGNWCVWCIRFHRLVSSDTSLSRILDANYEVVHVNYSPENKNEKVLQQLGYPQRFGFPVFVVLDGNGTRLHTQNSAYLEEGKGHSPKKAAEFLNHWAPAALKAESYKE